MIRLSLGTAALLGLTRLQAESLPTAAYMLHGDGCLKNCAFCPQARDAAGRGGRLGRVTWPSYHLEEALSGLQGAGNMGLQRICLQAVCDRGGSSILAGLVQRLSAAVDLPLSLSAPVYSVEEAALFFAAGAERLSIALDAASESIYARCKGGSLQRRLALLRECAQRWPGRMSTHLICGLGETEEEMAHMINLLLQEGIRVGLFAFTPLKGTVLENRKPPEPASYRRLQALHYLLRRKHISWSDLRFSGGRIISYGVVKKGLRRFLGGGEAFQTSGCPGCNRPYFNERPGRFIYNYPRPLSTAEAADALSLATPAGGTGTLAGASQKDGLLGSSEPRLQAKDIFPPS